MSELNIEITWILNLRNLVDNEDEFTKCGLLTWCKNCEYNVGIILHSYFKSCIIECIEVLGKH